MTESEAIAIARLFAQNRGDQLGPLSHVMQDSADFKRKLGFPEPVHPTWTVWFKYNGPPIEDNSCVVSPAPNCNTGIEVDDVTGEAVYIILP